MNVRLRRILPLALSGLLSVAFLRPAAAQQVALSGCDPDGPTPSFLSAENEVFYGCGWLFRSQPAQYAQAAARFRIALARDPENAVVRYLLGAALAGAGEPDSARTSLRRALAQDPDVERTLAARLAERPEVVARIDAALGRGVAPASVPAAPPRAPTRAQPSAPSAAPAATPAAPSRPATSPASAPARTAGGPLVLGSYACTYDSWSGAGAYRTRTSQPKGSFTLRADGSYAYLDNGGSGRYRYDAATGGITWLSGPIAAMHPEKTTYRRNTNTTQIDIRMKGIYEWSCGRNLR